MGYDVAFAWMVVLAGLGLWRILDCLSGMEL